MRTVIEIASLFAFLTAAVAFGSTVNAADWQISGSGCNSYSQIEPIASGNALQFPPGLTGGISLYCPITNADIDGSNNLGIYVQDNDGLGGGEVYVQISGIHKRTHGGAGTWCQIGSGIHGNRSDFNWQQITRACSFPFDTSTYNYIAYVTISRFDTASNPKLFGIELY
jgi:hypothetical protein